MIESPGRGSGRTDTRCDSYVAPRLIFDTRTAILSVYESWAIPLVAHTPPCDAGWREPFWTHHVGRCSDHEPPLLPKSQSSDHPSRSRDLRCSIPGPGAFIHPETHRRGGCDHGMGRITG